MGEKENKEIKFKIILVVISHLEFAKHTNV